MEKPVGKAHADDNEYCRILTGVGDVGRRRKWLSKDACFENK